MIKKDIALVIIDVQNDYFEGGLNPLHKAENALIKTKEVLQVFRDKHLQIIHIQHISLRKDATFFIKGTEGANIHTELSVLPGEDVIVKHAANGFFETNLDEKLKQYNIEQLVVCGMMSHHCVDSTVRSAKDFGYDVVLIQDACATKNLELNGEIIKAETVQKTFMASLQGFAKVIKADELKKLIRFTKTK